MNDDFLMMSETQQNITFTFKDSCIIVILHLLYTTANSIICRFYILPESSLWSFTHHGIILPSNFLCILRIQAYLRIWHKNIHSLNQSESNHRNRIGHNNNYYTSAIIILGTKWKWFYICMGFWQWKTALWFLCSWWICQ